MLWKVKDRFAATEYFLSSIRCEPTANAFYGLGIAYWQSGHWNQDEARLRDAEAALAKAVELKPDHAQAKEQLARLRQTLKRAAR